MKIVPVTDHVLSRPDPPIGENHQQLEKKPGHTQMMHMHKFYIQKQRTHRTL